MQASCPILIRKRLIPPETIALTDDVLLYRDDRILVTAWRALHPKPSLERGYSCYFLQEGYKVSKFYRSENVFRHWYCDIIETDYNAAKDTYLFTDLLADVIIRPDGFVKVVDLNELSEACAAGLLTGDQLCRALSSLDALLGIIYDGKFSELTKEIETREGPVA